MVNMAHALLHQGRVTILMLSGFLFLFLFFFDIESQIRTWNRVATLYEAHERRRKPVIQPYVLGEPRA